MQFGVWDSLVTWNIIYPFTAHIIIVLVTKFQFQYVSDLLYCVQVHVAPVDQLIKFNLDKNQLSIE